MEVGRKEGGRPVAGCRLLAELANWTGRLAPRSCGHRLTGSEKSLVTSP